MCEALLTQAVYAAGLLEPCSLTYEREAHALCELFCITDMTQSLLRRCSVRFPECAQFYLYQVFSSAADSVLQFSIQFHAASFSHVAGTQLSRSQIRVSLQFYNYVWRSPWSVARSSSTVG
jgi:hypothetical protein